MHTATRRWTEERNLNLQKAERREEALIYILGRVGRETLPPEVWVFLAQHSKTWVMPPQSDH